MLCVSCDFSLFGEPHDQGLVFKWGSLVGLSLPTTGTNHTSPFVAANAVFTPAGFVGVITDDWATVPYCENDFANYGDLATDHLADIHDPTRGIGDICRHMGVIDSTNWRIPTAAEWDALYRERDNAGEARRIDNNSDWSPGSFYPLHGYAFGLHRANVAIDESHGITSPQVTDADPYINGAVFLSPIGIRESNFGACWYIGSIGFYLSSTAATVDNGYDMYFDYTNVVPRRFDSRAYAYPIRCIRE